MNYVKCFTIILCALIALPASASDGLWIARLDSELTGINVDDPLAISKLTRYIKQVEQRDGQFAETLYQPLRQLAVLQSGTDPEQAIEHFRRMQNLVHRHFGVLSDIQFESIDFMIDAYLRSGHFLDADTQQEFRFRIARHSFDRSSDDYHYAGLKLADWYRNTMRYTPAAEFYRMAAEHFNGHGGRVQVRILRAQALNDYLSGACCAVEKLDNALEIVSRLDAASGTELVDLKTDLIDMHYLAKGEPTAPEGNIEPLNLPAALLGYRGPRSFHTLNLEQKVGAVSAWTTLMLFEKEEPAFGGTTEHKPVAIGSPIPFCTSTYDSLARSGDNYRLDIAVNVDARGRASEISIKGDAPVGLMRLVKSSLHEVAYRPAIEAGTAVDDGVVSFRQTFDTMTDTFSSSNRVDAWSRQLVAQSCQLAAKYI